MIGFLILGVALIVACILIMASSCNDFSLAAITTFLLLIGIVFMLAFIIPTANKDGQEKALKGQSDYVMKVRYELNDTTLTPVDTVFTLKTK